MGQETGAPMTIQKNEETNLEFTKFEMLNLDPGPHLHVGPSKLPRVILRSPWLQKLKNTLRIPSTKHRWACLKIVYPKPNG